MRPDVDYGVSLRFYERVADEELLDLVRTLEDMHCQHQVNEASQKRLISPEPQTRQQQRVIGPRNSDLHRRGLPVQVAKDSVAAPPPIHRQPLYSPMSLVLLSPIPAPGCLEECLRQLYDLVAQDKTDLAERHIRQLLCEVPLPHPGWTVQFGWSRTIGLTNPGHRSLPMFQYSLCRLFSVVSPEMVLQVFTSVLLEYRILLISRDPEMLMLVAEALTALLYPFSWQSAYVPILPRNLEHCLEAPFAFIMGYNGDLGEIETGQVDYILAVEDGVVVKAPEDIPLSPFSDTPLVEELNDLWHREFERRAATAAKTLVTGLADNHGADLPPQANNPLDDEHDHAFTIAVRESFLGTFVNMFSNMNTYIIAPEEDYEVDTASADDAFDKMAFLSDQPRKYLQFYLGFLDSQIFTSFMEEQGFGHGSEHSGHSISYFKSLCTESAWFGEESSARPKRASAINIALRCRPSGIVSPTGRRGIEDSDPPDVVAGASADHNPSTTTSMLHFLSRTADCAPLVYNFSLYERKLARAHRSHAAALQNSDTVQRAQSLSTSGPLEGSPRVSHNLASPRSSQDRPSPRSSHLVRRRSFPKHGLLNLATRPDAATTHESFISVLLVEIATKVKKCVLEAIGTEVADSLGYSAAAASADNSIVALCDVLERVWRHGCRYATNKSCLWLFLTQATKSCMTSGKYDIRKNVAAVSSMAFLKTDVGRARAWIRLCIEQRVLNLELELLLSAKGIMTQFFKEYAFLLHEECTEKLLSHLLSLTTVELLAFSPQYPALERVPYRVIVRTAAGSKCGTTGVAAVTVHGTLISTDRMHARGPGFAAGADHEFRFVCKNIGAVRSIELSHDGHGSAAATWTVEEVQVDNLLTLTELIIPVNKRIERGDVAAISATTTSPQSPRVVDGVVESSVVAGLPAAVIEVHDSLCQEIAASVNCIIRAFERKPQPELSLRAQLLLGRIRFNSADAEAGTGVDAVSDGGLCRALLRVMGCGLKKGHPWDFIARAAAPQPQPRPAAGGFRSPSRKPTQAVGSGSPSRRRSEVIGSPRRRGSTSEASVRRGSEMVGRRGSEFSVTTSVAPRQLSSDPDNLLMRSVGRAEAAKVSKAVRFEFLVVSGAHHHLLHVWFDMFAAAAANSKMYEPTAILRNPERVRQLSGMLRYLVSFPFGLIGRLLYARYEEGAFWELSEDPSEQSAEPV